MKTHMLKAAAYSLLMITLGCGLHQDPLAGKDTRFKDGRPEPTKPIYEKPVGSDAVHINSPDFVSIEEGKLLEFDLNARILLPDYVVELKIENLSEYPNAKFNATTGKFTWTPPIGFVNAAGGTTTLERKLLIRATAVKTDAPVLFREREIKIKISREYVAPTITQVRKDYNVLREGYSMYLRVRVKDMDALEADRTTWPEIQFSRPGTSKSLVGWIDFNNSSVYGRNEYELIYRIDLTSAELTKSGADFITSLTAVTRYGKRSNPEQFGLTVFTSLNQPSTTWTQTQDFKAGEKRSFQFVIFDAKQEGRLALQSWRDVPTGATVNCTPSPDSAAVLLCTIEWEPALTEAGKQAYIYANVQVRNTDFRDTASPAYNLYLSYRVAPANFIPAQTGE